MAQRTGSPVQGLLLAIVCVSLACPRSRCDDVCGVSESIITGTPIPLGTGMFRLLQVQP
jgi:hypothetical protein